jgi:hypothetical protein
MTYFKTALITSAIALTANATAFAGDMNKNVQTKMQANTETSVATTLPTAVNDTVGELLQSNGEIRMDGDNELLTHDGDMLTKYEAVTMDSDNSIQNNAIVVPSSTGAITTVNCPIGTTAQPDMTCMVTGNYDMAMSTSYEVENEVAGAVETKTDYMSKSSVYKGTLRPNTVVIENVQTDASIR